MAKIKKYKEISPELSRDTVSDMMDTLSSLSRDIDETRESFSDMKNKLKRFKSDSNKSNDQIDECYLELMSLENRASETLSSISRVNELLDSYLSKGRDFLF